MRPTLPNQGLVRLVAHMVGVDHGSQRAPLWPWMGLLGACCATSLQAQSTDLYDHHIHLLSPRLIAHWKSIGMSFSHPDAAYSDPARVIETEGIAGGFLVSMAHLYVTDGFRPLLKEPADERTWLAAENDFIGECAATRPGRFVGFFSVSPLSEYAMPELERSYRNPRLTGLKLHLPACGVDLEKPSHVRRLTSVLAWAAAKGTPVLLHAFSGEPVDLGRSTWFWNELIGPHNRLELYLAHLGSAGGYNESAHNMLEAFRRVARENGGWSDRKIYFDLSGAIIPEESPEGFPTSDEQCRQLANQIQRIGFERFLFASDYPVFSVANTRAGLLERLPLSAEEKERLLKNRSHRFEAPE